MQVIFSERAYNAVVLESADKINSETGGVFLGFYENETWYVIETIEPGPKAVFQETYFEYDQQYVEYQINKMAQKYYVELTLIGNWHKHPGALDEFSVADGKTNSDYAVLSENGAISVLVNMNPEFRIMPYHVTLPLKYIKIDYKVGDDLIPPHLLQFKNTN
jgi:integrative and conjugative element protein (TIGR02256 family)